jgi:hypothetical protein
MILKRLLDVCLGEELRTFVIAQKEWRAGFSVECFLP